MMALIFLLLLVAIILAWYKHRRIAIGLFIIALVLAVIWFGHHVTSSLNLQL